MRSPGDIVTLGVGYGALVRQGLMLTTIVAKDMEALCSWKHAERRAARWCAYLEYEGGAVFRAPLEWKKRREMEL